MFREVSFVVVEKFGGLQHGKGVHLAVAVDFTFVIIEGNVVVLLRLRQTHDFLRAVRVGRFQFACDVVVQSHHRFRLVVKSNVVGIAVRKGRRSACGKFGRDLVANAGIVAEGSIRNFDVGIELVEVSDALGKDSLQALTHTVVERYGDCATVVSNDFHVAGVDFATAVVAKAGSKSDYVRCRKGSCRKGNQKFLDFVHGLYFSY